MFLKLQISSIIFPFILVMWNVCNENNLFVVLRNYLESCPNDLRLTWLAWAPRFEAGTSFAAEAKRGRCCVGRLSQKDRVTKDGGRHSIVTTKIECPPRSGLRRFRCGVRFLRALEASKAAVFYDRKTSTLPVEYIGRSPIRADYPLTGSGCTPAIRPSPAVRPAGARLPPGAARSAR